MAIQAAEAAGGKHRLIFGGSFNPIHYGHLICARAVAETLGYQRVILVPSAQPPHKPGAADLASAEDRAAMAALAIQHSTIFELNKIELKREGPSYTIDTALQLKNEGWGKINWLIGADMVQILPEWHQAERLLEEVNFVLMARPGWGFEWDRLPKAFQHLRDHVVAAPMIQITATEIRQRVRKGRSIEYLTPSAVAEYIQKRNLYRR